MSWRDPPFCPITAPDMPWEKVEIDIFGPIIEGEAPMYIIVVIDHFSKWPEIEFTSKCDANAVVCFMNDLCLREGTPKVIVSDNGPQFTSVIFQEFVKRHGIKHKTTSVYHPADNGAVERFNRVVKGTIQLAVRAKLNWRKEVLNMIWCYRITPCTSTGHSPFALMRGRLHISKDNVSWSSGERELIGHHLR